MYEQILARRLYDKFSIVGDLFPGVYTKKHCQKLADQFIRIKNLAKDSGTTIVAHNYMPPELQLLADVTGDSLELSFSIRDTKPKKVVFLGTHFMAETCVCQNKETEMYVVDHSWALSCSLVRGTDYRWLEAWKAKNPDGKVIIYINSSAYAKSLSDYVSTSRNTDEVILACAQKYPGKPILILPDKYLGLVMKARALAKAKKRGIQLSADQITVYEHKYNGEDASCYVHKDLNDTAMEEARVKYPNAKLLRHPECGCQNKCEYKLHAGIIPGNEDDYYSTGEMIKAARAAEEPVILVATEMNMLFKLRQEVPEKEIHPVLVSARCKYMGGNTIDKLEQTLLNNRIRILVCKNCCDPKKPFENEFEMHVPETTADDAKKSIDAMMDVKVA